jgi:hypothetical protein
MRPVELILASGLCVSSAPAHYNLALLDDASSTRQPCGDFRNSASQAGPHESIIVEKKLTLEEKIDAVFSDPENFEDGELPPVEAAVTLKGILSEASAAASADIPDGDVNPYFGELSITWRRGDKMLRLTAFSNGRKARLDFGTTPERSLGAYEFNPAATGETLVDKLNWLATDSVAKAPSAA